MRNRLAVLVLLFALPAFAADPLLNWIHSPEAYFASQEEVAQWNAQVGSAGAAQAFIDEYFRKRGDAFKKELRTRIEIADEQFTIAKIPGSRTQMGRVFILLGPPNEQRTNRGASTSGAMGSIPAAPRKGVSSAGTIDMATNRMQDSALERGARITSTWIYAADRLPASLGMPELKIDFNTHTARGEQYIENPGLIEPYLRRAAAHFSERYASRAAGKRAEISAQPARLTTGTADPLWNATPTLNGAVYTGEAFVSPTEAPFYAVSFFLPNDVASFKEWNSGLFVTLVRDARGAQVVADRQQLELQPYDKDGNRYVDRAVALPPGSYEGLFALYSPDGIALLASHRERFEVPSAAAPRASRLLLSSHVDTLSTQDAFDPFTFVAQKYAVRGDRRFRASDGITLFTVVANPTGSPAPQLMQKLTFTRDGKSFATPLERVQPAQTGPNTFLVGAAFGSGTFKPGHYKVELQLFDFNAPAGSELRNKGYVLTSEFDVQ